MIKIEKFFLEYPSYYIKVELYNQHKTVVLLDSRNQNRTIYIEYMKSTDIRKHIQQNLKDLEDMYEKKYKVSTNKVSEYKNRKLYVLEYNFTQIDGDYRSLKYFWEVGDGEYLCLYCLSPISEFDQVYQDFVKIWESVKE